MKKVTNADVINAWANAPQEAAEDFGDEGDFTRKYLLDSALFALLGDIKGKNISMQDVVKGTFPNL